MNQRIAAALCFPLLLAACGGKVEEGPQPVLTIVGATSLDFGLAVLAGTSLALDVTLENRASDGPEIQPLENIAIGVSGAGLGLTHDCPASLASGAHCTIRVAAEPVQAGSLAGTLVVASNAESSPHTLPISGNAVGALDPLQAAFAWATGSSGSFGAVDAGGTEAREISITNVGNQAGVLTAVVLRDAGDAWSLPLNPCPVAIEPKQSCIVSVTFAPPEVGPYEARLEFSDFYHDHYAAPQLSLTGSAVAASAPAR